MFICIFSLIMGAIGIGVAIGLMYGAALNNSEDDKCYIPTEGRDKYAKSNITIINCRDIACHCYQP
ncbi:hypothetical protein GCM10010896_14160 [Mammaliicoccus stepanovicii]|nr:hypothetical protein GCM10010896_14160 [Mammaliicoccus stepanovicii]